MNSVAKSISEVSTHELFWLNIFIFYSTKSMLIFNMITNILSMNFSDVLKVFCIFKIIYNALNFNILVWLQKKM